MKSMSEMLRSSLHDAGNVLDPGRQIPTRIFRTPCLAHLTNLVIKDALSASSLADMVMFGRKVGAVFSKSSALCAAYQEEYSDNHYLLHSIGFLSPPLPQTVIDIRWASFFDAACIVMDAWELIVPFMKKVAKEHTSPRYQVQVLKFFESIESIESTGLNVFDAVESLQTHIILQ